MRRSSSSRLSALALLLTLLVSGSVSFSAGAKELPAGAGVMDARLTAAVQAGASTVRALLTGPAHIGITERTVKDRADANAKMSASARPFFEAVANAAAAAGVRVVQNFIAAPAVLVEGPAAKMAPMSKAPGVTSAALDDDKSVHLIEPMPDLGIQNTGGRAQLQAEDIWALGFRGEGIKVVIIDTGLDPTHEAFKNADGSSRVAAWKDWVNSRPTPYDDHGHGTHVGGTSVGSSMYTDPTHGVFQETGVAPNATLMVSKFLDSGGGGSFANAINSLQWSYDNGADITSNSWGASCSSSSIGVMASVRQLTDLGMLSVFAAGNSGPGSSTVGAPACSESSFSIGAIDQSKNIASFSSRGPCTDIERGTPSRICPDVVAKGVSVRSAIPRSGAGNADPTGYKVWQGTSMATPHASGAVALAEQMKRFYTGSGWDTASRAEEAIFKSTTLDLGAAGEDNTFGWGLPQLLNIYAILNATDEANIVSTFNIAKPVVRQGDTNTLSCTVRNLGGAAATGTFVARLTDPAGNVTTLKSSTRTLGLLDGEGITHTFAVGGSAVPGDYTFACSFPYTWTDGAGNPQSGDVQHSGTFKVAKVFLDMRLAGLKASTHPLDPQGVTFTATNTGNEDAADVTIEVTVPDDYVFVPGANFDPQNLNSRYSNPTPARVVEDKNFGRVTLIYTVGTLAQGASFSFTSTMLPTTMGTYRVVSVAKFKDGAGKGFSQGSVTTQEIGLPSA